MDFQTRNKLDFIHHYLNLMNEHPYLFRSKQMGDDFYNFILNFSNQVNDVVDPGDVWEYFKQTYPEHFEAYYPHHPYYEQYHEQYFPDDEFMPELDEFIDFDDKDIEYLKGITKIGVSKNPGYGNRRKTRKTRKSRNPKHKISKYTGLSYDIKNNRWRVRLRYGGRQSTIGSFESEKEALDAYNYKVLELGMKDKVQVWRGPS